MSNTKQIKGMLLVYHLPLGLTASTIKDHIKSFERYSTFPTASVNTATGFPPGLRRFRFDIILLHYSLFGIWPYQLPDTFLEYLDGCSSSYKIAFFQDEYRFCQERFSFVNAQRIDCIFTRVPQSHFKDTYKKYTNASRVVHTMAGYVSDDLISTAARMRRPSARKKIDIGYRARELPYYLGRGGQEKHLIAEAFLEHLQERRDLILDIRHDEDSRLYGSRWYRFLANCRACLGVEGGSSIYDLDGLVFAEHARILKAKPDSTFEQFESQAHSLLHRYENIIPCRSITPRHFEMAAFETCQILLEGQYSGILRPMTHYIPVKKDFSNLDEVMDRFRDTSLRRQLTDNAYRDLIASRAYSYRSFIKAFDSVLLSAGLTPSPQTPLTSQARRACLCCRPAAMVSAIAQSRFPGRRRLGKYYRILMGKQKQENSA